MRNLEVQKFHLKLGRTPVQPIRFYGTRHLHVDDCAERTACHQAEQSPYPHLQADEGLHCGQPTFAWSAGEYLQLALQTTQNTQDLLELHNSLSAIDDRVVSIVDTLGRLVARLVGAGQLTFTQAVLHGKMQGTCRFAKINLI